jgi:hypothetical protein
MEIQNINFPEQGSYILSNRWYYFINLLNGFRQIVIRILYEPVVWSQIMIKIKGCKTIGHQLVITCSDEKIHPLQ